MTQMTTVPDPSAGIVRWQPPPRLLAETPKCHLEWRDNVARRQEFEAAYPDVIWPGHERSTPWVAYVPMPDGTFLEVSDTFELGRLLDNLAIAVAQREAQHQPVS